LGDDLEDHQLQITLQASSNVHTHPLNIILFTLIILAYFFLKRVRRAKNITRTSTIQRMKLEEKRRTRTRTMMKAMKTTTAH
jgi:hypothetical protein